MKKFKAESQKVLDMMINSIYTHKEVFLRELVSNASDAIDKLYYKTLTDGLFGYAREDFKITIQADKANRTLTITDNGCGMNSEELEANLGVIAHSGSLEFKKEASKDKDISIIGQFGVGFYSGFMIAKKIEVLTKKYNEEQAFLWKSDGSEGYSIAEAVKETLGTEIKLFLKDNAEEEDYDEFLSEYKLQALIKKYSDYVRYPIIMEISKSRKKEDSEEYEEYVETETVNSMVPLWKKKAADITEEEYNSFYQSKFMEFDNPLKVISTKAEGNVSYNALLFVPSKAPYNYYSKEFEKGLQLYTNGVLIMERCADLLPDYFSFIKGVVDTEDVALNVSREVLQHNRVLKLISSNLEKKIKNELMELLIKDREKYNEFFGAFGLQLKFGIYNSFGAKNDLLIDLIEFKSLKEDKMVTLSEYLEKMPSDQNFIYYACGKTVQAVKNLPETELVLSKGYDILCLTDHVDEFLMKVINKFKEKELKSVADKDIGITVEDKGETEEDKSVLDFVKNALEDKVTKVKLSSKLVNHPVCLSNEGEVTLEMEKVFRDMDTAEKVKAQRVLEINGEHNIYKSLKNLVDTDKDKAVKLCRVLYAGAELIAGLSIEDSLQFVDDITTLI